MPKELISVEELAKRLYVSKQTIYNWVKSGMPYVVYRPLKVYYEDVLDWQQKRGK